MKNTISFERNTCVGVQGSVSKITLSLEKYIAFVSLTVQEKTDILNSTQKRNAIKVLGTTDEANNVYTLANVKSNQQAVVAKANFSVVDNAVPKMRRVGLPVLLRLPSFSLSCIFTSVLIVFIRFVPRLLLELIQWKRLLYRLRRC